MTRWPDNRKGLIFNQINSDILGDEISPFHIEYFSLGPVKCHVPCGPLVIRLNKCKVIMCANLDAVDYRVSFLSLLLLDKCKLILINCSCCTKERNRETRLTIVRLKQGD